MSVWWIGLKLDRGLACEGILGSRRAWTCWQQKYGNVQKDSSFYLIWRGIPRVDVVFSNDLKRAQTSNILG
jgi:hypothetical protein